MWGLEWEKKQRKTCHGIKYVLNCASNVSQSIQIYHEMQEFKVLAVSWVFMYCDWKLHCKSVCVCVGGWGGGGCVITECAVKRRRKKA